MPVTPTCTVPTDASAQERVELPEPETLVGLNEQEVLLDMSVATPAKPFRPLTVIVEVPVEPALTLTLAGAAAIVKSCSTNVTVTL